MKTRRLLAALVVGFVLFGLAGIAAAGDFNYIVKPPRVRVTDTITPNAIPFCKTSSGTIMCYTPSLIRSAYNFPSTLTGEGQTILIVDAYGSPTVESDLAAFDATFGLPAPPSFKIVCPSGCPTFNPNDTYHDQVGWSIETSLDVEYAHAMAPGANIVLVVAPSSSGNAINEVEAKAIKMFPGSILSQSFGIPEYAVRGNNAQIMQAHKNYQQATAAGITILASAGDSGATNGANLANAGFPASDPLVTAVGGRRDILIPAGLLDAASPHAQACMAEKKSGTSPTSAQLQAALPVCCSPFLLIRRDWA